MKRRAWKMTRTIASSSVRWPYMHSRGGGSGSDAPRACACEGVAWAGVLPSLARGGRFGKKSSLRENAGKSGRYTCERAP